MKIRTNVRTGFGNDRCCGSTRGGGYSSSDVLNAY
jgi:hypothetical protein